MRTFNFDRARRRAIGVVAVALTAVLATTACAGGSPEGTTVADEASTTIAVSFPNYSRTPSLQVVADAAQAEADRLGVKLILDDPGSDLDKQVSTIETWIPQGYGTIIAVALDSAVLDGVAKRATEAGVKWVTYGSSLKAETGQIDLDQTAGGKALGEMAADWFNANLGGVGKIALLTYEEGQWAQDRRAAIEKALKENAPGVEIVARQDALSETEGLEATTTLLQAHPDLNGVLGIVDSAAYGAYGALKDKKDPNFFIGGIDGTVESLKLIQQGDNVYRASSALDLKALGEGLVQAGLNAATGKGSPTYTVTYVPLTSDSPELSAMIANQG
jgi:ribose transport system substrate-binding protein